jgi:biotin carboxyl carrier protein
VYAAVDGVVDAIHIDIGESVEAKDLVMELRER